MQKKTFTRWANMSLNKKDKIGDLFEDLKSGAKLLKLVNILSGSQLRPERGLMNVGAVGGGLGKNFYCPLPGQIQ